MSTVPDTRLLFLGVSAYMVGPTLCGVMIQVSLNSCTLQELFWSSLALSSFPLLSHIPREKLA